MGRQLANGIATKFVVVKRKDYINFDFKKEQDKILNHLNQYIDISSYDIETCDDGLVFSIKKDFFNKHIHELLKEIEPLTSSDIYFLFNLYDEKYRNIDINSDNFNNENYPLELKFCDENYQFKDNYQKQRLENKFFIENDDNMIIEEDVFITSNYWPFVENKELLDKLKIYTSVIMLWIDWSKIDMESETHLLLILNTLKNKYYKNPLARDLIYFIEG